MCFTEPQFSDYRLHLMSLFSYYYRLQTKFAKVMFSQVFVCLGSFCPGGSLYRGFSVQGCLCSGVFLSGEGLYPGGSLSGDGLCPGGVSVRGSLSRGVSVQGVFVKGDLCPGLSFQWGICPVGYLSRRGLSLSRVLCPVGYLSSGYLSRRVSVQGVCVQGGFCHGEPPLP